ncbi:MAG: AI-2E family transporter [Thermodesulfobacteriota bacterium]
MEPSCRDKGAIQDCAAWMLVVVLGVLILKTLSSVFIPLSFAVLFFFALGIPLEYLKRYRLPRWLRITAVVTAGLGILHLVGTLVQVSIAEFMAELPGMEQKLLEHAAFILGRFGMTVEEGMTLFPSFMSVMQGEQFAPLGVLLHAAGGSLVNFFGASLWVLLFLVFILAERESWSGRLRAAFGERQAGKIIDTSGRIIQAVEHYLGLKTLICLVAGISTTVVLLCFDVRFAVLWGMLTFLCHYIPNIGALLATAPPVAVALFQTGSLGFALLVASVLSTLQMVLGNFLEPKIMGRGLNLSPLVVLLSLVFWSWMWGGVGMLLAVPITAAVKIAMEEYEPTRPLARVISDQ